MFVNLGLLNFNKKNILKSFQFVLIIKKDKRVRITKVKGFTREKKIKN
jgi:hypothetical protein